MRVGPRRLMPTVPGRIGARARKYSSSKITCCIKLAPRPPYSFGQEMPTQPAACIFFCQARRFSSVSRSGETRWSCASSTFRSSGRLASSQARNSRRKSACSGESAKSMGAALPRFEDTGQGGFTQCQAAPASPEQVFDLLVDELRQQRIGARPDMQHVIEMFAEIHRVLGIEAREDIDETDA